MGAGRASSIGDRIFRAAGFFFNQGATGWSPICGLLAAVRRAVGLVAIANSLQKMLARSIKLMFT